MLPRRGSFQIEDLDDDFGYIKKQSLTGNEIRNGNTNRVYESTTYSNDNVCLKNYK